MKPGERNLAERVRRSRRRGPDYPWWWNVAALYGLGHFIWALIRFFDWLV